MERLFIIGLFIPLFIFASCSQKKKQQPGNLLPVQKVERKLSITSLGIVQFVRSFSFLQSSTMSKKEIDKQYEETEKSNPVFTDYKGDSTDIILKEYFERLGLVEDDEFLLSIFKYSNKPDTSIVNSRAEKVNIRVYRDTVGWGDHDKVYIFHGPDSASANATIYYDIKYVLLDVIPGGNKELVVLNEHYLMNTEFYYLEVFEIKTTE